MRQMSCLVLKLLLILILAGWVSLWVLKPTEFWTRKWKKAEEKATASVYGYNGLDFVVYTFPVIAMAIIGFIYLELKQKEPRTRQRRSSTFTSFSSPLFVNQWQYKLYRMATRSGLLAEACLALLLLPVLRGMSVFRLLGVQFEGSVRYHTWLGTAMVFLQLYSAGIFFIWGVKHRMQDEMWKWQRKGRIYLAGEMALITALVIWITSLPQIRRNRIDEHTISVIVKCENGRVPSMTIHDELDTEAIGGSVFQSRYNNLLLVAGGIGITPFVSIVREITSNYSRSGYPHRIQLIYTVRNSQDVCLLDPILPQLLNVEQFHIKLKVFVTRENQTGTTLREVLDEIPDTRTAYFSTCSSYATYGINEWMAPTVSSIIFLLSLVCFNHFVTPPAKKHSEQKNSSSQVDLVLLCSFAIAITCSTLLAITIRWKRVKKELQSFTDKQSKTMKQISLQASRDLDEHEIHFGGRPNFRDIFSGFTSETGGSDIGVLVCGPEPMKESVASACRLAPVSQKSTKGKRSNFSFHSLNFTL
ncbi:UNVERIFIED_CONTAM: Ferric reduction oxidase 8, mitochondrial [Sesamum radiatum]|uniref:Ferric reduction oxidase 8, mitochondrial n=1 Tax=Sesamum radiatum TaxID=300843 RepID=A0AAW2PK53_SESRA